MDTEIRNMTRADIGPVGEILFKAFNAVAEKHGYAPKFHSSDEGTAWAWALLRHRSSELLVAVVDNRVAGMCCLNARGDHAGLGPVAVDPAVQGSGIGTKLITALLRKAEGLRSVRLFQEAFNLSSFSLYYSFDFLPVACMLELFMTAGAGASTSPQSGVAGLSTSDCEELIAYDGPRSQFDRRADFELYLAWGTVLAYRSAGEIRGFLVCLPGSRSVQLGPLVAEGEEEAGRLFRHAVGLFATSLLQTRVLARDRDLVRTLGGLGFLPYCLNNLMVRGSWRPGRHVEAFGRFPEGA
jgi:predicted N-acetyltransferase YhbS